MMRDSMMKKMLIGLLALGLCFGGNALAMEGMDHGSGHDSKKMDHGSSHDMKKMDHGSKKMDHGSMKGKDGMIMMDGETVDGVSAMAHLKDVRKAMAEAGMEATHHLMIMFEAESDARPIEEGSAAVKITIPGDKELEPLMMMGMVGHFGVDINMAEPGIYHFKVGTKLDDGKKRTFHFHHVVE